MTFQTEAERAAAVRAHAEKTLWALPNDARSFIAELAVRVDAIDGAGLPTEQHAEPLPVGGTEGN